MADISLMGATYSDVPAVDLPTTSAGTARFYEVSGSQTVTENGTYDTTTLAHMIVSVAGGGYAGMTFETGTYTPSSDIARPTISFANSHSEAPVFIFMVDVENDNDTTTNTNIVFCYQDFYKLYGTGIQYNSSSKRYARASYTYRSSSISSSVALTQYNSDSTGSSSTSYPRYWATESEFHPYSNSTSRYWRAGRTYKWFAIWKETVMYVPNMIQATGSGSSISIGTSVTQIPLTATNFTLGEGLSIVDSGIQVTRAGTYRITASVYLGTVANCNGYAVFCMKGSSFSGATDVLGGWHQKPTGLAFDNVVNRTKTVELAAGDILYLGARCGAASGTAYSANGMTFLEVEQLQ